MHPCPKVIFHCYWLDPIRWKFTVISCNSKLTANSCRKFPVDGFCARIRHMCISWPVHLTCCRMTTVVSTNLALSKSLNPYGHVLCTEELKNSAAAPCLCNTGFTIMLWLTWMQWTQYQLLLFFKCSEWIRVVVITYKNVLTICFSVNCVFWHIKIVGASCNAGDLSLNSKCYRKFDRQLSWFSASNECLSSGGSLAVFTVTGRPSDNSQLIDWLNTFGADKSYWIGLVRSWWETTDKGEC